MRDVDRSPTDRAAVAGHPSGRGSVLSVSSRALLSACARLGLDTRRMLLAARLDPGAVDDPDARIPIEQVGVLWQTAYELSGDPDLALHAVEVLPFGAYRVIDYLASTAPTVGAALAKVSDCFPIIHNGVVRLPYAVGDRLVTFAVEAPSCPLAVTRTYAEYTLAAAFLRTRLGTRQPYRLMRVDFSHARPANITEHERIFECPVTFDANACQLVIARDVWETRSVGSEPSLFSILDTHAKMLLDQLPSADDIVGRVREAIETELRGGNPKLESIASRLAITPRTLQRRLRERGVLFNDVLDATRFRAAKSYLAQRDVAASEVAYLLGFAEQSSFNRAFRRWSGQTPTEYRYRAASA